MQTSPLNPGAQDLGQLAPGSLDRAIVLAPPGTLERRYVLAQALTALKVGGELIALAPKDRGGSRLGSELEAFGLAFDESGKRHHRVCLGHRPKRLTGLDDALAQGAPREVAGLGWSQPGVFSWDRMDPGTAMLIDALPPLSGQGADFGCGLGLLAQAVLKNAAITRLSLIDIDRRAVDCARRNVADDRVSFTWADVRNQPVTGLDFVVMNPPFHDGGSEDRTLGRAFIAKAAKALNSRGVLWLVANRHLPYEAVLAEHFASSTLKREDRAFKVYEAVA